MADWLDGEAMIQGRVRVREAAGRLRGGSATGRRGGKLQGRRNQPRESRRRGGTGEQDPGDFGHFEKPPSVADGTPQGSPRGPSLSRNLEAADVAVPEEVLLYASSETAFMKHPGYPGVSSTPKNGPVCNCSPVTRTTSGPGFRRFSSDSIDNTRWRARIAVLQPDQAAS